MGAFLLDANSWTIGDFDGHAALWQSAQGAIRGLYALALLKFAWLESTPCLLCRLDESGVAQRCRDLWALRPVAQHHRVSREFLDPLHPSGLSLLVDTCIGADGFIRSEKLLREVRSLQHIPMDDAVAEGPHAVMSRHKKRRAVWLLSVVRSHVALAAKLGRGEAGARGPAAWLRCRARVAELQEHRTSTQKDNEEVEQTEAESV